MTKSHLNKIQELLTNSKSELTEESLLNIINSRRSLANYPIEPLYFAIETMSMESLGEMLPLLSKNQRKGLWHIDFWKKDRVYPEDVKKWVVANFYNKEALVKEEFLQSSEFLLFLKTIFNIWTFDYDEPEYPEHNNYFLTEDALLLVEFKEEDESIATIAKALIQEMYSIFGVEQSYTMLFKIVATSYVYEEEELYKLKCSLLNEFGFLSHYEALKLISPFPNIKFVKLGKVDKVHTPVIDKFHLNQSLSVAQVRVFEKNVDIINSELSNIESIDRQNFLKFNLIRTLNASFTLAGGLKKGRVALLNNSKRSKTYITLGINYLKSKNVLNPLSDHTFGECYKIGMTLLNDMNKDINNVLKKNKVNISSIPLLGKVLNDIYQDAIENTSLINSNDPFAKYNETIKKVILFKSILPYSKEILATFLLLKKDNKIDDTYYFNQTLNEIDFEDILLTLIVNHFNKNDSINKLGVTIDEFKNFYHNFYSSSGKIISPQNLDHLIIEFCEKFGVNVDGINNYIFNLFQNNLEGYLLSTMKSDEYKHVGGVILLYQTSH